MRVLVTGATGHVGGQLVPALLTAGHRVRVLSRRPDPGAGTDWADRVEVTVGDAAEPDTWDRALAGVGTAYYLLHSMGGRGGFRARDRRLAEEFAAAAARAGVRQVVYLGGLHPEGPGELSEHLASRVEVGRVLLDAPVPAAVLQAGIVLGAGSASYEVLRHLAERLPVMIAPRWLRSRVQPIAVDDVVHLLARVAELPAPVNRTFDVGGPDVLTYQELLRRYAARADLGPRLIVPVPVLTPGLAAHWVGLVTPVGAGLARPLVASLSHDAVCDEQDLAARVGWPSGSPTGVDEAIDRALRGYDPHRWRRTLLATSAATAAAALVGSLATSPESRWYRGLSLPSWQPPPAAFPVVWTALYGAVAVAGAAVQAESPRRPRRRFAAALGANLVLNAGWSVVFFDRHRPVAATAVAAALTASGADLTRRARRTGRGKAAVFAAYTGWCGFATVLTGAIARRNRGRSGRVSAG